MRIRLPLLCIVFLSTLAGAAGQTAGTYVWSTLAGRAGFTGSNDGPGGDARFRQPWGVAVDAAGNVYVAEAGAHLVRKITPAGVVSTLAGQADTPGSLDGIGVAAQFGAIATGPASLATALSGPFGIVVDGNGTVIVADGDNHVLRSITPARVVSTFAGTPGQGDLTDGPIASAQFRLPFAMARDSAGVIYVADMYNHVIRRITPAGVVSTIAGAGGLSGYLDGVGNAARFLYPCAIAVDGSGNLYVADANSVIRRVSPTSAGSQNWATTTIAGERATFGLVDATGASARFGGIPFDANNGTVSVSTRIWLPNLTVVFNPTSYVIADLPGLAADAAGNVFVADFSNNAIRRISPEGVVTTIGGSTAGGSTDGAGATARFSRPAGIAIDSLGNLYVADNFNHTIRKGVPSTAPTIRSQPSSQSVALGSSVTLAIVVSGLNPTVQWSRNGAVLPGATSTTLTLPNVQYTHAGTYTATVSNTLGAAPIVPFVLTVTGPPVILTQPVSQNLNAGQSVTLNVVAGASPAPTYQWLHNGNTLAGATNATLALPNVQAETAGEYRVVVINANGSVTSEIARVVVNTARIVNLSIRTALTANQPLIVGFVASGGSKPLLVRAVGPSLGAFGVTGVMPDPRLTLFSGQTMAASNDNWTTAGTAEVAQAARDVGAFALGASSLDSALLYSLESGGFTAQTTGAAAGIVLFELYDLAPTSAARLVNVSARGRVGTGDSALFAGFVISGNSARTVLIRAIGPTLTSFGVPGVLSDPRLDLYAAGATLPMAGNDNWGGVATLVSSFAAVGAFPLPSNTSLDAALRITLNPGPYTARVSGINNAVGEALLEVYEIP